MKVFYNSAMQQSVAKQLLSAATGAFTTAVGHQACHWPEISMLLYLLVAVWGYLQQLDIAEDIWTFSCPGCLLLEQDHESHYIAGARDEQQQSSDRGMGGHRA